MAQPVEPPSPLDAAAPDLRGLFGLDGRRCLIVGAYGGIGEITSRAFVECGATVAVAGRSLERARALAGTLESPGRPVLAGQVDVAEPASVDELVTTVADDLGGLDVVVNLAGIDLEAKAEDFAEADWRRVLDVNLSGAFWLSQAAGRRMIEAGRGGRIVHFSSTRAVAGGRRGFAAYGASKAGVNMLVKQLATEWGRHAITVNGVAPGFVPTGLVEHSARDEGFVAMLRTRIPFGRFGQPVEMAGAALFLAGPAASFMTGQILYVDGGVTASS